MWKSYAKERGLPWSPVTTFEVATREADVKRVEKYYRWGLENGMGEDELELLTAEEVRKLEPHVKSHGAIWSKTDTSVDYPSFTRALQADAEREGVRFIFGFEVKAIGVAKDLLEIQSKNGGQAIRTRFLVNCAGGNSMRIAHMLALGREYADLNFRGEYWEVGQQWAYLASRNIYTVAQHPELPFLDPHWICRADGRRWGMEIVHLQVGNGKEGARVHSGTQTRLLGQTWHRRSPSTSNRPKRELHQRSHRDQRPIVVPHYQL